jgi:hypothetical protein
MVSVVARGPQAVSTTLYAIFASSSTTRTFIVDPPSSHGEAAGHVRSIRHRQVPDRNASTGSRRAARSAG